MKRFWPSLLKPRAWVAKLLLVVLIAGMVISGYLGYLQPVITFLDSEPLTFFLGATRLSAYSILKASFTVVVLFWLAGIVSEFGEQRIKAIHGVKGTSKALLTKLSQIIVYFLAFIIGLDILGIDLTALAIFSGAVGIGVGFGLQKITSNFISGLILLFEKSIEIDDLVELGDGILGFVRHMGARYTLIETFDGKEIMVPNEDFITSRVTNWTYSSKRGRIDVHIGVSYESDIELVRDLLLETAREHPRCLTTPEPVCVLRAFADSSVNFMLSFWVDDVSYRRLEPQSDVMRSVWKKFKHHGIVIPYPQLDLHVQRRKVDT
ncbi:mechanosensitive ion channel family protein [Sneathiella chinensis]|uniref:Mechanosensitive ion channel protein MscS n=1 Tax=Sneathiella chinensis TaxID=349750 RepID=A0ABQ5U3W6_9PROT|nr:mechanosensitive ion channel domain-containing protein [Sneathiella chinensis]GLQ05928.1 hypothetical protein GCM10007924_11490 [Sneathiella chinensis]